MRLWEIDFRETVKNPLNEVWDTRNVLAESFEVALAKARKTEAQAYPNMKLEVTRCQLIVENIDEDESDE